MESGLFPLFQAEQGRVTDRTLIRHKVKVEKYLELQGRFKHLFDPPDTEAIAAIQAIADANINEFDLLDQEKGHGT